jgi:hypothetical protein
VGDQEERRSGRGKGGTGPKEGYGKRLLFDASQRVCVCDVLGEWECEEVVWRDDVATGEHVQAGGRQLGKELTHHLRRSTRAVVQDRAIRGGVRGRGLVYREDEGERPPTRPCTQVGESEECYVMDACVEVPG